MTTIRGRVPVPGGARRAHLPEARRESLWFWPAVAAIAAWVGERRAPIEAQREWLRGEVAQSATSPGGRVLTPDPLGLG